MQEQPLNSGAKQPLQVSKLGAKSSGSKLTGTSIPRPLKLNSMNYMNDNCKPNGLELLAMKDKQWALKTTMLVEQLSNNHIRFIEEPKLLNGNGIGLEIVGFIFLSYSTRSSSSHHFLLLRLIYLYSVIENLSPRMMSTRYFIRPLFQIICNNHSNTQTEELRQKLWKSW
ncbi:hypothetical protein L6164_023714 [Bauhinia variegata]|uniref:Uncharacterized protein n=1 Tax=Bauhinia variegata TaxID=167791 RepID=A0ACB9MKP7_BAUVA|nr:hypothetical protein L6164_023714 [Bauhinia variegata]